MSHLKTILKHSAINHKTNECRVGVQLIKKLSPVVALCLHMDERLAKPKPGKHPGVLGTSMGRSLLPYLGDACLLHLSSWWGELLLFFCERVPKYSTCGEPYRTNVSKLFSLFLLRHSCFYKVLPLYCVC